MATATHAPIWLDSQKIVDALKRDEGFRQFPYGDTKGVLTVGYGFNLASDGLSQEEAVTVLHIRALNRYYELLKRLPWLHQLDEARQGVLVNMAYNLGVHGLLEFQNTLALIVKGDYSAAADAMLQSRWAEEVGPRAQRLAQQMRTGVWQ